MQVIQKNSLTFLLILILSINCVSCTENNSDKKPNNNQTSIPHTDGKGLPVKLPPLSESEKPHSSAEKLSFCSQECVTPFGQFLGEADGVKAYSNCQSTCVKPEYSFLNLKTKESSIHSSSSFNEDHHYIGVVHQCVEYARKWWMLQHGITFGSIDSAFEIIYLTHGKDIYTNKEFSLGRSVNGSAKRAPKRGDLLIYSANRKDINWQHGHVAVVVNVDLDSGTLAVAEENYNNRPWDDPKKYSRKIKISKTKNGYQVDDLDIHQQDPTKLGKISGWIYPLSNR